MFWEMPLQLFAHKENKISDRFAIQISIVLFYSHCPHLSALGITTTTLKLLKHFERNVNVIWKLCSCSLSDDYSLHPLI